MKLLYNIVQDTDFMRFEINCNKLTQADWEPIGGVSVTNTDTFGYLNYAQAFVKYDVSSIINDENQA